MQRLNLVPTGAAEILQTDGLQVTLTSERAFPPGATLHAVLQDHGDTVQVKVTGCHKTGEQFQVKGRFVTLSRATREKILA